jgi:hypothetical protein
MADDKKSKAQSVREYLEQHPEATPQGVADALGAQGVNVDAPYVSQIKSRDKTKRPKLRAPSPSRPTASAKGKPWTFPKNPLEEAIRIPKQIEEDGGKSHACERAGESGWVPKAE